MTSSIEASLDSSIAPATLVNNVVDEKKVKSTKDEQPKKFTLKTPKGTKDYTPHEMSIRESIFSTITTIFKKHGAVTIDTPTFELKSLLSGKYGEDSKLIYDLVDQGGEICSLRYDLTVPFARFLAMNGRTYQNVKRYQIAKVYRRDQPSVKKGRMREFYQCDFDIAGDYQVMVPDAEAIKVMHEILTALDIGAFTIRVNHRKLLDGMFQVCGVPEPLLRCISSAVDKLDKMSWEDVKKEMVYEKGLDAEVADKIGKFVKLNGGIELCDTLESMTILTQNASAAQGILEMRTLLTYLSLFSVQNVSFDLSLARGLDYYTGVIYEAVFDNSDAKEELSGIGSIAGGGRYDELVGMFSSGQQIPCVGVSIGVERIYALICARTKMESVRASETEVYVCGIGNGTLEERMRICNELWNAGIKAEFMYKLKPKLPQQFAVCEKDGIPLALLIGEGEIEKGVVNIKDQRTKGAEQVTVLRSNMIEKIRDMLKEAKL